MAHQPHNIPWSSLTSNLRWAPASRKTHHIADYHPQGKPNQGDDFTHFVKKFVQCLKEQSEQERKKYPEAYQRPDDDEDIIGDAITAKIFPTIRKWRKHAPGGCNFDCAKQFCSKSSGEPPCCPILPLHERKMSAFCREYQDSNCYLFYEEQSPGYFNMEVVKTLILYGDMEPLLRACSHPDVAMEDWRTVDECGCCGYQLGWDQIYEKTLISYIGLNVIYSFPETWDLASGRDQTHDYRNSRVYQALLANILACYATSVVKQPHSQIFGLEPPRGARLTEDWWRRFGSFTDDNGYLDEGRLGLYGRISYDEFLILERLNHQEPQYDPDTNDIVEVRSILRAQGLPTELVLDIMEIAEYSTKRGVKVPHDPFHPDNRDRLRKYINYCWQLLVRCEMLTKELKVVEGIDWESLVTDCIINDLWGSTKDTYRGQLSKVVENEETHGRRRVFK